MQKTSSFFVRLAYIYAVLPVFIFIIGWCNIPTALAGVAILLFSFVRTFNNAPALWVPQNPSQKRLLLLTFLLGTVWVYLSGIGALVFQNLDHNCRNPIFEILVQAPWPVRLAEPPAVLTYYIGFWLPPAVIGKLLHSVQIGYYAQICWASIGVFLFFYLLLAALKHKTYWPILLFLFFSGLDAVGCVAMGFANLVHNPLAHLEWWYPYSQFSSFTTQLFWVFNQAIPAWVTVMILWHEKNNKSMAFLYACLFINSTLPAIGLFPFIVYWYFKNTTAYTDIKTAFRHLKTTILHSLTFQNIIGALFVVLVSFAYLSRNAAGASSTQHPVVLDINILHWLLFFLLPEVGFYLLLIWQHQKRNILYYLCWGCFLIYPFIRVGGGPDFCMRATIPALILLYVLLVRTLEDTDWRKKYRVSFYVILLLLGVGALTPLHEFTRTIHFTRLGYTKVDPNLSFDNFFGYTKGNIFLKYFGKQIKN